MNGNTFDLYVDPREAPERLLIPLDPEWLTITPDGARAIMPRRQLTLDSITTNIFITGTLSFDQPGWRPRKTIRLGYNDIEFTVKVYTGRPTLIVIADSNMKMIVARKRRATPPILEYELAQDETGYDAVLYHVETGGEPPVILEERTPGIAALVWRKTGPGRGAAALYVRVPACYLLLTRPYWKHFAYFNGKNVYLVDTDAVNTIDDIIRDTATEPNLLKRGLTIVPRSPVPVGRETPVEDLVPTGWLAECGYEPVPPSTARRG